MRRVASVRIRAAIIGAILSGFAADGPARAAAEMAAPPMPARSAVAPAAAGEQKPDGGYACSGFRSAKFGMGEAEVRGAAAKDFGAAADGLKASTNPAEQTQVLSLRVPDLLPGGGAAEVSYVLGFKSKKLIQVDIVWSKATDPGITAERIYGDAEVLRSDLSEKGYRPESVSSGAAVKDGLLMFRGEDAGGHVTALLLQGTMADRDGDRKLTPSSLLLVYTADIKHPDVFRLAPGQF